MRRGTNTREGKFGLPPRGTGTASSHISLRFVLYLRFHSVNTTRGAKGSFPLSWAFRCLTTKNTKGLSITGHCEEFAAADDASISRCSVGARRASPSAGHALPAQVQACSHANGVVARNEEGSFDLYIEVWTNSRPPFRLPANLRPHRVSLIPDLSGSP